MADVLTAEWRWYWRITDGEPDCGIFAEVREGHAYAICRCPRYVTEEQWSEYARHICDLHNANIEGLDPPKKLPKLTPSQRSVLEAIRNARPSAGNDEGWLPAFDLFKRPTVRALERLGMIEPKHKNYVGSTGGQYHRITERGRVAVFRL